MEKKQVSVKDGDAEREAECENDREQRDTGCHRQTWQEGKSQQEATKQLSPTEQDKSMYYKTDTWLCVLVVMAPDAHPTETTSEGIAQETKQQQHQSCSSP